MRHDYDFGLIDWWMGLSKTKRTIFAVMMISIDLIYFCFFEPGFYRLTIPLFAIGLALLFANLFID